MYSVIALEATSLKSRCWQGPICLLGQDPCLSAPGTPRYFLVLTPLTPTSPFSSCVFLDLIRRLLIGLGLILMASFQFDYITKDPISK